MPKVIKQSGVVASDEVVRIPAFTAPPSAAHTAESSAQAEEEAIFSRMMGSSILGEARERADEVSRKILESARTDRERILGQAEAEADRIRAEAYRQGSQTALNEKRAEMEDCLSRVDTLLDDLQRGQQSFLEAYEENLRFLALDIAEKVLCRAISDQSTVLLPLVEQAVSTIRNADWISVEVSEHLPGLVDRLKKNLAERQIDVTASDLPDGSCIIHTPEGVIDASVSVQLDNLKNLFQKMD